MFTQKKFDAFVAVLLGRIKTLGILIIQTWAIYALLVIFGLSWMNDFRPLPFLAVTFDTWLRGVFNGVLLAWTVLFVAFLHREEDYEVDTLDSTTQGIAVTGNKHWTMYVLGVTVLLFLFGLERLTTGGSTDWLFLVVAFVHILPLLLGSTLSEQARQIAPKIANWILIATAIWLIAVGITPVQ